MLCLLVVKGTKYLSPLGVRDLYSSLRTLSYTASKQNITSVLHFPFHAVLLIPQPQPQCWKQAPLEAYLQGSFLLLAAHGPAKKTEALLLLARACPGPQPLNKQLRGSASLL